MATVETTFAPDEGQHATVTPPVDKDGNPIDFGPSPFSWASNSAVASAANVTADGKEADLLGNKVDEGTASITVSNTDVNGGKWAGAVSVTAKVGAPPVIGDLAIALGLVFKQAA